MEQKNSEYQRIALEIANGIALGDFGSSDKLPSERHLAEMFSVSRVTIRAALREAEESGIISRRHGSGTFANRKNSIKLDDNAICFVLEVIGKPLSENPYASMCIDGIGRASLRQGIKFDLLPIPYSGTLMHHLKENPGLLPKAKGIILKWSEAQIKDAEWLTERGHVVVMLGPNASVRGVSNVDIDNTLGGKLAAERLLSLGRTRIAYLDGPLDNISVKETLAGINDACLAKGCPFNPKLLSETVPWEEESGFKAINSLISCKTPFDAVIVRGDMASLGAMMALRKKGLDVPNDISLIMYDDFPWMRKVCDPDLTAIRQPFDDVAECAVDIAMDSIRSGLRRSVSKILRPTLVVRDSCCPKRTR